MKEDERSKGEEDEEEVTARKLCPYNTIHIIRSFVCWFSLCWRAYTHTHHRIEGLWYECDVREKKKEYIHGHGHTAFSETEKLRARWRDMRQKKSKIVERWVSTA